MKGGSYRSSNARMVLLTINMLLFVSVVVSPKDDTALVLAVLFGCVNFIAVLDCLRHRSSDEEK